ncbi:hypothetical protein K432DRAFT_383145 [Lepidopterella palustris CBS 459.81]|uniref:U three protein 23 n=1 Tax=Lepidopterella palustris CBS 459.81 TaxID=1314670 RepID=A0A8E2E903_9PEZI|nr:hypothetical protein K432DRAFT_383145 [Lepidopterella palustris CBS 459.81]
MRGKRAKQYRKLMHAYAVSFNFREPYQVLLDAQVIQDAARFKMDLIGGLERTLQGTIKPMVTQCCMRHLYDAQPKDDALIDQAKQYERRRCNHHELEKPLSALDCLSEVVDQKTNLTNKHRYVVASQDPKLRAHMRRIPGVPLVYINRSVMILEPMANTTKDVREQEERRKLKAGLKGRHGGDVAHKRKREDEDMDQEVENVQDLDSKSTLDQSIPLGERQPKKKKHRKGDKGPNPLSVRKPKIKPSRP